MKGGGRGESSIESTAAAVAHRGSGAEKGRRGSIHGGREAAIASHEGDGIDGEGGRERPAYLSSFLGIAHEKEKRGKVRKCVCEETEREGKRRLLKGAMSEGPTTSPAVAVANGLASGEGEAGSGIFRGRRHKLR